MSVLYELNEGQTGWFDVSFWDTDEVTPAVPTSVSYEVHDLGTGNEVKASTALSPASTVTITLAPTETVILNDKRRFETRRITITALFGAGDVFVDFLDYHVQNLKFQP